MGAGREVSRASPASGGPTTERKRRAAGEGGGAPRDQKLTPALRR